MIAHPILLRVHPKLTAQDRALKQQLFETFANSKQLLRQEPVQALNRDHLKGLLQTSGGGIVFTFARQQRPRGAIRGRGWNLDEPQGIRRAHRGGVKAIA